MEDIEDLLVGTGAGMPPGFRLPVPAAVGVNPKQRKKNGVTKLTAVQDSPAPKIPGTQTIYIKTFGCSHNQVWIDRGSDFSRDVTIAWEFDEVDDTICRYLMDPKMEFVKFFGKNNDVDMLTDGIIKEIKQYKQVKA